MYDETWANMGWLIFFIGFLTLYLPMFYLGIAGMPRRYFDYLPEFHGGNIISSLGAVVMIMGLIIIILNLFRSARNGPPAGKDPWQGKTLEWTVDSPPSVENFEEDIEITRGPYEYE